MIDHRLNHGAITWMARGLTLAVAAAIALPVLAAQAGIGIVSGRVADETGLPIVGVTITLTNDATDSTVQAVTDETGHYVFEEVPSGRYVIGSRWTGFKMHSARVDVGANRTLEHDVTLAIGGLEETVEVSGLREPTPTGTSARFAPPRRVEPPPMPECEPSTTGGHVVPPRKTRNVPPSYPRDAIDRDANGIVILEATITTEGAVDDVGILRDPDAALSQAAIDAVSQWAFTPTLLNCEAVPVVMNVTVNYVLR